MSQTPLRVAIDGRVLVMRPTGIGHYTRSLLSALARQQPGQLEAVFFTHDGIRDTSFWPGRLEQRVLKFPSPMLLRPLWDDWLLPGAIRREDRVDLYFSPLSVVPPRLRIPSVATVHDLAFLCLPRVQPWKYRWYWRRALTRTVRRATRLIAVSEATRQDLARLLPASQSKTHVVYEAPGSFLLDERAWRGENQDQARRFGRYLLAVGTLEPRKNYSFLLRVFSDLLRQPGCEDLKLVIAGGWGWSSEALRLQMAALGEKLICLGYVEPGQLPALYRGALALVFPSLYEGFGLPAVEAMAVGTPVVASRVSSLPEVVGPGGILLSLEEPGVWVRELVRIASDPPWRQELAERGRLWVQRYSWERAARDTWAIFQEVVSR